jgi:hypothetical protein
MNPVTAAAGILIAATGMVHSVLGERRIIKPLLAAGAFEAMPRAGRAIRFTWHLVTLLMVLTALTVAWPGAPVILIRLIGAAYLLLGLLSLAMTRGRHISGPLFTGAGLLALIA